MVVMMVRMQTGSSNRIRLEQALDLILAMYSAKRAFFQSPLNFILKFFLILTNALIFFTLSPLGKYEVDVRKGRA